MKKALLLGSVVAVLMSVGAPLFAWEFSLRGEAEWRYRYISRTGPNDLFGNANTAQHTPGTGTSIGFAGPNIVRPFLGPGIPPNELPQPHVVLEGYSSKGSDASYGQARLWLYPEIKINEAMSVRAIVTFQGNVNGPYVGGPNWATNALYSGWVMIPSRDFVTGSALAVPVVEAFWGKIQLPWGICVIGQRPAGFGMGWLMHENDMYTRSASLLVPYGPFTFVFSQNLHDRVFAFTDPNDPRNINQSQFAIPTAVDQNLGPILSQAYAIVYNQANLSTGAMFAVTKTPAFHTSLGAQPGTYRNDISPATFVMGFLDGAHLNDPNTPLYGETVLLLGVAYLKYTNGRFFLNAEYDLQHVECRRNGGRPISGTPQAWAAEAGFIGGPMKLTLAHFYRSGHDRRGGILNLRLATGYNLVPPMVAPAFSYDKWYHYVSWWGGGETPMRPYNFLLGLYGTGNNSYNSSGYCTFEDFLALGGRLDYAAAANLNLFGSFIQAYRASNTGSGQGFYDGVNMGSGLYPLSSEYYLPTPNVDSTNLGWELNLGFNWKLLEGLTFNTLFAFWKPGDWFRTAYRDMTISNPAQGVANGIVNGGRTIDPIIAFQTSVLMEF